MHHLSFFFFSENNNKQKKKIVIIPKDSFVDDDDHHESYVHVLNELFHVHDIVLVFLIKKSISFGIGVQRLCLTR